MDILELIKQKCKCCVTEGVLSTSSRVNMVQLHFKATWSYPVWGNIITGTPAEMAVAFVHDDAIGDDGVLVGPVKFAVEINGKEITYHHVPACRVCGCTDDWCPDCIARTGQPCEWLEPDLCTACKHAVSPIPDSAPGIEQIRKNCLLLFEQSIGSKFRVKGTPLVDQIADVDHKRNLVIGKQYGNLHIDLCELTNTDEVSLTN